MTAQKVSLDEFMEKRRPQIGKAQGGQDVVFKGFRAPPSFNPETRTAEFVMSSERIDRDGDIVRQKGLSLTEFKKNPVALLFHSSRSWPVGTWSDVKKDTKAAPPATSGVLNFLPSGGPVPEVDQSFWMVQNGALRAVSIGFLPLDLEMIEHKEGESPYSWGFLINSSELYECSLVSVPAQPDSLAKGLINEGQMACAKEFIEQAIDDWARDPRTSMFVPKKELADTYRRFFGKSAVTVMALDSVLPAEKSALKRVEDAVAKAAEEHGLKQITLEPMDPAGDVAEEVDAVSGIQIHINISQGATGANTRTGSEVGDEGTAAADASVQAVPPSQREAEPEVKEPHPLLVRAGEAIKRFFGGGETPTTQPKLVPGAYEQHKDQISSALERLRAL